MEDDVDFDDDDHLVLAFKLLYLHLLLRLLLRGLSRVAFSFIIVTITTTTFHLRTFRIALTVFVFDRALKFFLSLLIIVVRLSSLFLQSLLQHLLHVDLPHGVPPRISYRSVNEEAQDYDCKETEQRNGDFQKDGPLVLDLSKLEKL